VHLAVASSVISRCHPDLEDLRGREKAMELGIAGEPIGKQNPTHGIAAARQTSKIEVHSGKFER
jgi:hypothetical protein